MLLGSIVCKHQPLRFRRPRFCRSCSATDTAVAGPPVSAQGCAPFIAGRALNCTALAADARCSGATAPPDQASFGASSTPWRSYVGWAGRHGFVAAIAKRAGAQTLPASALGKLGVRRSSPRRALGNLRGTIRPSGVTAAGRVIRHHACSAKRTTGTIETCACKLRFLQPLDGSVKVVVHDQ